MNTTKILGLRTTIYKVQELQKAKEWYTKAFGVSPYFEEPYYVGFNIGGYELGLLPNESTTTSNAENVLSYWGVEKIQETFDHLLTLGATIHEEPQNVGGKIMTATVKDPWKNIIGIIYNPHFDLTK